MKRYIIVFFFAFIFSFSLFAHKIKVFASMDGKKISGYVYFSGGGRPKNMKVEVLGSDGRKLASVFTNAEGRFVYEPKKADDFTFVVNSGDGHKASYTVKSLGESPVPVKSEENTSKSSLKSEKINMNEFRRIIGEEVSKQLMPLREQVDGYEEKIRFRDILGGIGFIFGIAGIYFYFLARNKK
jgi:nickel transport protein